MKQILLFFISSAAILICSFGLLEAAGMKAENKIASFLFIGIADTSAIWFLHSLIFKKSK